MLDCLAYKKLNELFHNINVNQIFSADISLSWRKVYEKDADKIKGKIVEL